MTLVCSIILLQLGGNISSAVRYSYLSILPGYNADISAASLLILHCSFSILLSSSIVITSFYILSKKLFLKRKRSSDARVASFTKKEYGLEVVIVMIHKVFKVNI